MGVSGSFRLRVLSADIKGVSGQFFRRFYGSQKDSGGFQGCFKRPLVRFGGSQHDVYEGISAEFRGVSSEGFRGIQGGFKGFQKISEVFQEVSGVSRTFQFPYTFLDVKCWYF